MSNRHKRVHERMAFLHQKKKFEQKRYSIPRWKSQAIGTRSRGPKPITLSPIVFREVKA